MKIRLAIRWFVGGAKLFEERLEIPESDLDKLIPEVAARHAQALAAHKLHVIEIEFLDEPDPMQRFFRFGTDPSGMVDPIIIEDADLAHDV